MVVYSACQGTPNRWATTCNHFPQARTQTVSTAKKVAFIDWGTGGYICRWGFPHGLTGRTIKTPKLGSWLTGFSSLSPSHADAFCWDSSLIKNARACLFHHSLLGLGSQQHGQPLWDFPGAGTRHWLAGGIHWWITAVVEWARGLETW